MESILKNCNLCPRNCGINRFENNTGFCGADANIKIAKAYLHKWEEPCISGTMGSGTVFFSNCNLKCVFCQNYKISSEGFGKEISIEKLSEIFIKLENEGAHNINLVSATHYVPMVIKAIELAKAKGIKIPFVYNTSSYETVENIRLLKGYIDIYLPDLKYFDDKYAIKYSNAPNYFKYASKSINEMVKQVGSPKFNNEGLMKKGVIIRHLMLPGLLFDSKKIIDYINNTYKDSVYISIMNQYTPFYNSKNYPEINRPLNPKHYESFIDYCISLGIQNAFIQEEGTVSESFIPEFDLGGIV